MEAMGPAPPLGEAMMERDCRTSSMIGEAMMEAMGPAPPLGEAMMDAMGSAPPLGRL